MDVRHDRLKSWAGPSHMALRCRMEEPLVKDFMQVGECSVLESWLRPRNGWWGAEVGRTVCPGTSGRLSPWEEGKVSGHSKSRRGHPRRARESGRHRSEIDQKRRRSSLVLTQVGLAVGLTSTK